MINYFIHAKTKTEEIDVFYSMDKPMQQKDYIAIRQELGDLFKTPVCADNVIITTISRL